MKTPMVNFPLAIPFVIISTNSIIAMEVKIFSETILPQVQQIIGVKTIHQPIIVDLHKNLGKIVAKVK